MDVRRIFQDIVAPELRAIEGRFEAVNAKLDALNMRIDSLEKRIDSLEKRIENIRDEFHIAINLQERLPALEAKIGH